MVTLTLAAFAAGLLAASAEVVAGETFLYKTIGDRELHLYLEKPLGWKASDQRPAIVFFFGGGWDANAAQSPGMPSSQYAT